MPSSMPLPSKAMGILPVESSASLHPRSRGSEFSVVEEETVAAPDDEPPTPNEEVPEEDLEDEEAEGTFGGVDSFSEDEWPPFSAE